MVLILVETAAGYGLFRVAKKGLLTADAETISASFETGKAARKAVSLHAFARFKDTASALADTHRLLEAKLGKGLKKFLRRNVVDLGIKEEIAVADKALAGAIKNKFNIDVTVGDHEIVRGIREQLTELVTGLTERDLRLMSLSLSHSLNRFKLKFSADRVDVMIIQAVGLLDDLDRELNNFAMRLKEWYGWHFPELLKIVTDNQVFAKAVLAIGLRSNCKNVADLDDVVGDPSIAAEVKQAAEISMGTDITDDDIARINTLAKRVLELTEYRAQLAGYLETRMRTIAPNITHLVGELVGARLISHAGSLMSLAKHPASTVQILGAEKALFRALKAKQPTPKYGLIFYASQVGGATPKLKGKISRILAAKLALASRVDALTDSTGLTVGIDAKKYVQRKMDQLQEDAARGVTRSFERPNSAKRGVTAIYSDSPDQDFAKKKRRTVE